MQSEKKRVLISGACGFWGSHLCEEIIKNHPDWDIVTIDRLSYASNGFDRLREIKAYNNTDKVTTLTFDLRNEIPEGAIKEIGNVDYIFHLAASTHVQRSIEDPEPFIYDNIVGTFHMLQLARKIRSLKKFIMVSTDEVYGDAPIGVKYKEADRHNPKNPYSGSKASAEMLCLSWHNTYKVPIVICNSMNIYGERQNPEKYVPLCVKKILRGEKIQIHINVKTGKPGSRFWIHARNSSNALLFLAEKGVVGESYNIAPPDELDNLQIAQKIAGIIGRPLYRKLVDWHSTRPGHDSRYALDGNKLRGLGWKMPLPFGESFRKTIEWSIKKENLRWLGL